MPDAEPFALYHWAPVERRASIIRLGLVPGRLSSDGTWRPPHVCLARSPLLAWSLIGRFRPMVEAFDLWWTSSDVVGEFEVLDVDEAGLSQEYRVAHRIPKRHLWHVATRTNEHYDPSPS